MRQKLREAVEQLPPIYREVLVLRDLEELNQEETASALGINVTLVKVRLHRARMMLQKMLAPYLRAEAPARKGFFGRLFQWRGRAYTHRFVCPIICNISS